MISHGFERLLSLLLPAFLLWSAQDLAAQGINYKLVPNLQQMWGPADWYSPGARQLIKTLLDEKKK